MGHHFHGTASKYHIGNFFSVVFFIIFRITHLSVSEVPSLTISMSKLFFVLCLFITALAKPSSLHAKTDLRQKESEPIDLDACKEYPDNVCANDVAYGCSKSLWKLRSKKGEKGVCWSSCINNFFETS